MSETNDQTRTESDNPRIRIIFLAVVAGVIVLLAMVIGIQQYFDVAVREEIEKKQLEPVSTALRQLRAQEAAKLSRYQWVDQQNGVLRIPVERARELVLSEWASRPSGFTRGTLDTPAAGAPSTAQQPAPKSEAAAPRPSGQGESKTVAPTSK